MAPTKIRFEPSLNYEDALHRAALSWGIEREFWDIFGQFHVASEETVCRILTSMGVDTSSQESIDRAYNDRLCREWLPVLQPTQVVEEARKEILLAAPADLQGIIDFSLELEQGPIVAGSRALSEMPLHAEIFLQNQQVHSYRFALPENTPLGYHRLRVSIRDSSFSGEGAVIVCPSQAWLSEYPTNGGRTAGVAFSLYGVRSQRNWGCGDFTDLHHIIDWVVRDIGGSFIALNPLHALHNRVPYNTSPYLPLSIFYKNFIYLDIEKIPEFSTSCMARGLFASVYVQTEIAQLRASESVEYERVARLKKIFLKALFREFKRQRASLPERAHVFNQYVNREGDLLHKFALYCALDEVLHKQNRTRWVWQNWPAEFHHPTSSACQSFAQEHQHLIEFYKFVQWQIDEQLSHAQTYAKDSGLPIGLYHDLALATDRFGSDLWAHRQFFVEGCRVGAPPDAFSPMGQDWAFPPPNRDAHRENGYQLFRETIGKIAGHGGALRIDHVMRLFRLYWIADGKLANEGVYVRDYPEDLLRILALESVRNQNIIVGEDLGTVADEVREGLAQFRVLSYRLFYFEQHADGRFRSSAEYPQQALVSATTHDLPTIAGFWTNRDIESRRATGILLDDASYQQQLEQRRSEKQKMVNLLHAEGLLPAWYPRDVNQIPEFTGELHNAIIGFLARTPSALMVINQEDLTKETEQQNLPGTTAQYPNWRRKMKLTVEELAESTTAKDFCQMLRNWLQSTGRSNSETSH